MKARLLAICVGLLFFASSVAAAEDAHSRAGFMPQLGDWEVSEVEPLFDAQEGFSVVGGEVRTLKSDDGRSGELAVVESEIIVKSVEVEGGHRHAAILMDGGEWAMGELETGYMTSSGVTFAFCLEDYFSKTRKCGVMIYSEKIDENTVRLTLEKKK